MSDWLYSLQMQDVVSSAQPGGTVSPAPIAALTAELLYAWDKTDRHDLRYWAIDTEKTFGRVFARPVVNVSKTLRDVAQLVVRETGDATVTFIAQMKDAVGKTVALLKDNPRDAVPHLLTMVVASLVISGATEGDGAAPDLDLIFGVGARRDILAHSIVSGAALDTSFLSLASLVSLVHAHLPKDHARIWDALHQHAGEILSAANKGASVGMSYRFLVDGLVEVVKTGDRAMHERAHARLLRQKRFRIDERIRTNLTQDEYAVLRRYGTWLQALATGEIPPLTALNARFVEVANGTRQPESEHEIAWSRYMLLRSSLA